MGNRAVVVGAGVVVVAIGIALIVAGALVAHLRVVAVPVGAGCVLAGAVLAAWGWRATAAPSQADLIRARIADIDEQILAEFRNANIAGAGASDFVNTAVDARTRDIQDGVKRMPPGAARDAEAKFASEWVRHTQNTTYVAEEEF